MKVDGIELREVSLEVFRQTCSENCRVEHKGRKISDITQKLICIDCGVYVDLKSKNQLDIWGEKDAQRSSK